MPTLDRAMTEPVLLAVLGVHRRLSDARPRDEGRRMSQKDWKPFVAPTCVCGHGVAEHGRVSSGVLHIGHGPCFKCDCSLYVEVDEEGAAA
jgi:hypothetical protein